VENAIIEKIVAGRPIRRTMRMGQKIVRRSGRIVP